MDIPQAAESFRGLVLRHRGRTGLTQRELAVRMGAGRRTVQDWEAGLKYPTAERLQALIQVLLEAGGLTVGREAAEAQELWAAVLDEAPRMHTPFDQEWFGRLLDARAVAAPVPTGDVLQAGPAAAPGAGTLERAQDWGEAPDVLGFVGRAEELALLQRWVLEERSRLVAVLGMGGIGKTSLAAKLAQEVAPSCARVYWRSLRDAPPISDWLVGVIGFLSDQQWVPPSAESERIAALLQLLRERRCLLVLDNSETLFEPGQPEGRYRAGMAGYGRLFQAVGAASHQSCLLLTSREAPPELAVLGGAVRTVELGGLGVDEAQALLAPKQLEGSSQEWAELNARFGAMAWRSRWWVRASASSSTGTWAHSWKRRAPAASSGAFGGCWPSKSSAARRSSSKCCGCWPSRVTPCAWPRCWLLSVRASAAGRCSRRWRRYAGARWSSASKRRGPRQSIPLQGSRCNR